MILADKIIELRKRNGWSQEDLAEKLDVSRQSISKWEGAQSVPDMNRILKLSEVFGVSTDFLLKDEMSFSDLAVPAELPMDASGTDMEPPARSVSMEEATEFLQIKSVNAMAKKLLEERKSSIFLLLLPFASHSLCHPPGYQEGEKRGNKNDHDHRGQAAQ